MAGLGESPPSDNALSETLAAIPLETLVDELKSKDPQAAAQVDLQNPRRVVRAVEVIRLTGRPYSEQRIGWNETGQAAENLFCVQREVETLNQRIHARVDVMFEHGLVEETKRLTKRDKTGNCLAGRQFTGLSFQTVARADSGLRHKPASLPLERQVA